MANELDYEEALEALGEAFAGSPVSDYARDAFDRALREGRSVDGAIRAAIDAAASEEVQS